MNDVYRVDEKARNRRRRRLKWAVIFLIFIGLVIAVIIWVLHHLKPETTIKQGKPITSHITYAPKTKLYKEPDFTIEFPRSWHPVARPPGSYNTYTWQNNERTTNGQVIVIYEDTIPTYFSSNRILIVSGGADKLTLQGTASDNCSNYTIGGGRTPDGVGELAKWQNVKFYCDQHNTQRDVIGTSSTEGINAVTLEGPRSGSHKFFFTISNYNNANPDYSTFYTALSSLQMN